MFQDGFDDHADGLPSSVADNLINPLSNKDFDEMPLNESDEQAEE